MKNFRLGTVFMFFLSFPCFSQNDPFVRDSRAMEKEISAQRIAGVKLLLNRGYIDPNEDRASPIPGISNRWIVIIVRTPFAIQTKEAMIDLFLTAGADINLGVGNNADNMRFPISWDIEADRGQNFLDMLAYLLRKGANPNLGSRHFLPLAFILTRSTELAVSLPGQADFIVSIYRTLIENGAPPNPSLGSQSLLRIVAANARRYALQSPDVQQAKFEASMKLLQAITASMSKDDAGKAINALDDCRSNLMSYTYGFPNFPNAQACINEGNSTNPALTVAELARLRSLLRASGGIDSGPPSSCQTCQSLNVALNAPNIDVRVQ